MDGSTVNYVLLVNFHHERGNEIEWAYPTLDIIQQSVSQEVLDDIVGKAMPDQCHKFETDYCYFNAGTSHCVSCFQQVAISAVVEGQAVRHMVQKAVVAIASKPFFGQIRYMLQPFTAAWFHSGVLTDYSILELSHTMFNKKFQSLTLDNAEALYAGIELQDLILNFGRNALVLYKNQFLEKRTIFYGTPASFVSDTIVAFASLIPGYLSSLEGSGRVLSVEHQAELDVLGFPLAIFTNTTLEPYVTLASLDALAAQRSFIVGSSNPMFALGNQVKADLLIDLTDLSLAWKNTGLQSNCGLSGDDERFIDHIFEQVQAHREAELKTKLQNQQSSSSAGSDRT